MSATSASRAPHAAALEIRDLADPAQGPHAMQLIVDALVDRLTTAWNARVRLLRDDPVVTIADNYERLGYPPDAVTRDARYTRYLDETRVLRSHTSAMIPGALRRIAEEDRACADTPAGDSDILLAAPGICYRRDAVDWQHTGTPEQLDLWRLSTGPTLGDADLVEMIGLVVEAALPGMRWRTVESPHPYTLQGREINVRLGDEWIEIGECGVAGPHILADAGLDIGRWSGLAMGLGLDRLLLLRKGIPDIRLLRSTDPRVASQMLDLEAYRPVSHMPAVRRDLSLAVAPGTEVDAETLGDRVRSALGVDADVAETVEVVSISAYDALPEAAVRRLGMAPGQRNLLLRLELRALDRTLTDEEANVLRDRVYAALHEGALHAWASEAYRKGAPDSERR